MNGNSSNFNCIFHTSQQLQHHLHHRLKKRRGDETIKLKNATHADQNLRHQNPKQTSRDDHRSPVEAYFKKLPGTTHFRHPSSNSRACTSGNYGKDRVHRQGSASVPLLVTKLLLSNTNIGRAPPVLEARVLEENLSGNHYCDLKPVYNPQKGLNKASYPPPPPQKAT